MKFFVQVMPREVLLDSEGRAVQELLQEKKFPVTSVRVGKWIEVQVDQDNEATAKKMVEDLAQKIFSNPLIETFKVFGDKT